LPILLIKEFTCTNTNDCENGLFYFLGIMSSEDKKTWKSPIPRFVALTASSTEISTVDQLISYPLNHNYFCTRSATNSWIIITLAKPIQFMITQYRIKAGKCDSHYPRNWVLEGSLDGKSWNLLSKHVNDTSLKEPNGIGKWDIKTPHYFDKFRINETGPESSNSYYLLFQSIEFYGKVTGIS